MIPNLVAKRALINVLLVSRELEMGQSCALTARLTLNWITPKRCVSINAAGLASFITLKITLARYAPMVHTLTKETRPAKDAQRIVTSVD